jgi:hypothetical protein
MSLTSKTVKQKFDLQHESKQRKRKTPQRKLWSLVGDGGFEFHFAFSANFFIKILSVLHSECAEKDTF